MNNGQPTGVEELQRIKKEMEKKHPHMKKDGEIPIEKNTTIGKMQKPDKPTKIFPDDEEILKPKSSIFEPDPVPVKLPSGSLAVDKKFLTNNNEIFVRRMTSLEENIVLKLAGVSEVGVINQSIDSIIKSCVKTNIDADDLLLIDKFAVFFKIISITYGKIQTTLQCPSCDKVYENYKIDVYNDFSVKYVPDEYQYPRQIKLESYNDCELIWHVVYPTLGDTKQMFVDQNIDDNAQMYVTEKIEGWYTDPSGNKVEVKPSDYKALITNLEKQDKKKYKEFMDEFSAFGFQMTTFIPFCTDKKCSLRNVEQEVSVPVEDIFSLIISQYSRLEK
jgi:hypothetical protein